MTIFWKRVSLRIALVTSFVFLLYIFLGHLYNLKSLQKTDKINRYDFGRVFYTNETKIETKTGYLPWNYAKIYTSGFLIDDPEIPVNIMLRYPTPRMMASTASIEAYVEEFKTRDVVRAFVNKNKSIAYNGTVYWLGYEDNIELEFIINWFLGSMIGLYAYIILLLGGWLWGTSGDLIQRPRGYRSIGEL